MTQLSLKSGFYPKKKKNIRTTSMLEDVNRTIKCGKNHIQELHTGRVDGRHQHHHGKTRCKQKTDTSRNLPVNNDGLQA